MILGRHVVDFCVVFGFHIVDFCVIFRCHIVVFCVVFGCHVIELLPWTVFGEFCEEKKEEEENVEGKEDCIETSHHYQS